MKEVYSWKELVKKYGVKKAAQMRKVVKKEIEKDKITPEMFVEGTPETRPTVEEVRIEEIPEEETKGDIRSRRHQIIEMCKTKGWRNHLAPRIRELLEAERWKIETECEVLDLRVSQGKIAAYNQILREIQDWTEKEE